MLVVSRRTIKLRQKVPRGTLERISKIKAFINNDNGRESFESICREIEKHNRSESWQNPEQDKNKVFPLNNGVKYGITACLFFIYAIFASKSRNKDMGKNRQIEQI